MGCIGGCGALVLLPLLVCCCAVGTLASIDQQRQEETTVAPADQRAQLSKQEETIKVATAEPPNSEKSAPLTAESYSLHVDARGIPNQDIPPPAPGYVSPQGLAFYPDYGRGLPPDLLLKGNRAYSDGSYPDSYGRFDPRLNYNLRPGLDRNGRGYQDPSLTQNQRGPSYSMPDATPDFAPPVHARPAWQTQGGDPPGVSLELEAGIGGAREASREGAADKRDGSSRAVVPPIELTPDPDVVTISDIQRLGDARLERTTRGYYDSGADQEQTLRENVEAYSRLRFRPRVLVDVSKTMTATTVLGKEISMPIGIAPSAMQKLAHPVGEVGTARAAEAAGTVMILSTLSTTSLEDVRRAAPNCLLWYQLYVYQNRSLTESLVKRAVNAGYSAIVLTVDAPVFGQRIIDVKNRFSLPPNLTLANLEGSLSGLSSMSGSGLTEYTSRLFNPAVTWEDIPWLERISSLPIVIKGIVTPEAAAYAQTFGASAILVSNHGGRQLDGTPATIEALPEIVAVLRGRMEVYLDGGVRTGSDVAKALSLGARAVFIGRPALWGLAYNGTEGVARVLDILRTEFERTLALLGCPDSTKLTPRYVVRQEHYSQLTWRNFPRTEL